MSRLIEDDVSVILHNICKKKDIADTICIPQVVRFLPPSATLSTAQLESYLRRYVSNAYGEDALVPDVTADAYKKVKRSLLDVLADAVYLDGIDVNDAMNSVAPVLIDIKEELDEAMRRYVKLTCGSSYLKQV